MSSSQQPPARRPRSAVAAAPGVDVSGAGGIGTFLGRSLFPIAALALILGTLVWGPWVTLLLAAVWWKVVTRIG